MLIPYWCGLDRHVEQNRGIRPCVEMHGQQPAYNVPTLLRLREAAGRLARANYDPRIEHEDVLMAPAEGVEKSVDLLRRAMPSQPV